MGEASANGVKKSSDVKAEKELYERRAREKELGERDKRLEEHRRYLHEQMLIRRDYYSLGLIHKLIIFTLFFTLSAFVAFLVLSYFPVTKDFVHNFIGKVL